MNRKKEEEEEFDELSKEIEEEDRAELEKNRKLAPVLSRMGGRTPTDNAKVQAVTGSAVQPIANDASEKTVSDIMASVTDLEGHLSRLRDYKAEYEREREQARRESLIRLYNAFRECVFLYTDSKERVEPLSREMFRKTMQEFVLAGLLPSAGFSNLDEMTILIKEYMLKNVGDEGISKTSLLVGIGRSHKMYYDVTDFVLVNLVADKFLRRSGKRYFLAEKG